MFYDIKDKIRIEGKITKAVLREQLSERLAQFNGEVNLSDEDGAVEFTTPPRLRGKHPLKNITFGRVNLISDQATGHYISEIAFQLSLIQTRISMTLATVLVWGYSLFRGFGVAVPIAFTILIWLFGYFATSYRIRSRFREFLQNAVQ